MADLRIASDPVAAGNSVKLEVMVLDDNGQPYPGVGPFYVYLPESGVNAIYEGPGGIPEKRELLKQLVYDRVCPRKIPEAQQAVERLVEMMPQLPFTFPLVCS